MAECLICDKPFKDEKGLNAHNRFKHPAEEGVIPAAVASAGPSGPAYLPDMRRAALRVSSFGRRIKMFRPICATCQRGDFVPGWWLSCTHSPYISVAEVPTTAPQYEDLAGGKKKLVGTETTVEWIERPNWTQVSLHPRINGGWGVDRKRYSYGFIYPEELRTPIYPNGIANCCEFRNCFWQRDLKEYRWGRFCRLEEAQLIGHDLRMTGGGGALEIYSVSPQSAEKQRMQLEQVPVH